MTHSRLVAYVFAVVFAVVLAAGAAALVPLGPSFDLSWNTIDGGGGTSTGGGFELAGTIGQHDAGPGAPGMTGGTFELRGGFWLGLAPPPPSTADLTGPFGVPDGCVDAFDLAALLGAWCSAVNDPIPPSPPCENCSAANLAVADISGVANVPDGCVDAFDLAKLLAEWCSVAGGNPCGTCFPP